jgi:hypothetical protein
MREYELHIEKFSMYSEDEFGTSRYRGNWGNREEAERYLEKYWLPLADYELNCKQVQNRIFTKKWLPEMIFHSQYEMLALRGGCLFTDEDFEKLQECFLEVGDRHFYVIENTFGGKFLADEPTFRMKYPTDITWEELTSGNFISAMIIDFYNKEFFVFGETDAWGKYAATSYNWPLDIIGFLPKYASLFREKLKEPDKGFQVKAEWLPPEYQRRMHL